MPLDFPNVPAFVIPATRSRSAASTTASAGSSRTELSLVGLANWFKNLQSLAWGVEMMTRHDVYALPRKYRPVREAAVAQAAAWFGLPELRPTDVVLLATSAAAHRSVTGHRQRAARRRQRPGGAAVPDSADER